MVAWRQIQRQNFTCWKKLTEFLQLDPAHFPDILKDSKFPLNLPLRLAQKIQKNTWDDPILLQFLPLEKEKDLAPALKQILLEILKPANPASSSKNTKAGLFSFAPAAAP